MTLSRSLPLAILLVLGALAGCRQRKEPSPEFQQAHSQFVSLLAEKGERSYADPRMDEVLGLLDRVPPDSQDAPSARELRQRIEEGRTRQQQQQEQVAAALEFARKAPPPEPGARQEAPAPEEAPAEAAAPVDAGAPQPEPGMTVEQLSSQFSRCFAPGEQLYVPGRGVRDTWELKDLMVCRELHPDFVRQLLVLEGGKVIGLGTKSTQKVELPADGGVPTGSGARP